MRDLPSLVRPGDVVVVNTTRVLPARLRLTKPTGGAVEVLLLEPSWEDSTEWEALVRPSRKVPAGHGVRARRRRGPSCIGDDLGEGRRARRARCSADGVDVLDVLERHGEVPLPPVHHHRRWPTRSATRPPTPSSRARSRRPPRACTSRPALLEAVRSAGALVVPVELVVGLGTFRPIAVDDASRSTRCTPSATACPHSTMLACERAERVVAIGTTSVRALESAAATGELEGRTELFIHGDRPFALVGALMTNFHQPRSSLLALVDAFVGPRWRSLYDEALRSGYRFLSFGDAMFLTGERG